MNSGLENLTYIWYTYIWFYYPTNFGDTVLQAESAFSCYLAASHPCHPPEFFWHICLNICYIYVSTGHKAEIFSNFFVHFRDKLALIYGKGAIRTMNGK